MKVLLRLLIKMKLARFYFNKKKGMLIKLQLLIFLVIIELLCTCSSN